MWWVLFSFYLFLSFYVHATISKFHPTFSIINNVINWNDNKLLFYALLGLCGATIQMPIYLCAWHVLKAWCLRSMKKIKDNEVWHVILDDLHTVMYMPIEPNESIEVFMICERNKIIENFTQHLFGDSWTQYFWTYCFQVGTWINS